ncbi:nitrate regulatory protein [Rosenbergiella australiborealis]|uniref:nitrate regulatory protein n=1 Tax=Rosenbergiella australiborealis TaxID=1544696 RepID=UPI001F4D4FE3|nr:nitrate regulatory protein [Rosenbergiella australiborealis]
MALTALDFLQASKKSEITCLQQLLQMGKLVGAVSQLIHMLQRERGTANIYLCSQGETWADRLNDHCLQVQTAEQAVDQHLQALNMTELSLSNPSRLYSRIAAVLHSLSTLPLLRQNIQRQRVTQPQAMRQYCEVISTLLALVYETADASGDPSISRALLALFSFIQGKELAGQERALAAAGFTAGQFDSAMHQQLIALIDGQERCFQTFSQFADTRSLALWQQQLSRDSSEFERFRRIACTQTTPNTQSLDAALRWFELTTLRIDGMKQLEDELESVLMTCCRQRLQDAQTAYEQQNQEIVQIPLVDHHYASHLSPQLNLSILELVEQQARQLQAQDTELAVLRATLAERKLLERAKGLLIDHHGMTEQQAHKTLRDMAMKQNKKIVEIAEAMFAVADILAKRGA